MKKSTHNIITLTTDFGLSDAYVASMKGVILSINPGVTLVDITHNIPPQDVRAAAFLLHTSHTFFPDGAIHLAVVDPGVGSSRRPIALVTPHATFVAPDNGILSYMVAGATRPAVSPTGLDFKLREIKLPAGITAFHLNNLDFWRHPVSHTFHGRDIFAPVAAHLSLGVPLDKIGEPIPSLFTFQIPHPQSQPDGSVMGHIQHIDSFGNLISDIKVEDILPGKTEKKTEMEIEVRGQKITGISRSYAEGTGFVAIIGSSGYLEIALKDGNASKKLEAKVGDGFTLIHGYVK
ncbi:MAG: SAM-dependent chlorinase/fluorinase [Dehalococcoidia bacterium]|nr:SAM-dependent chlorinase/fluorinase [Dehalococcoidia bacterium]